MTFDAFTETENGLVLSGPELLSSQDWFDLCGEFRKLGYSFNDPSFFRLRFTNLAYPDGFLLNKDQEAVVRTLVNKIPELQIDPDIITTITHNAKQIFGTTDRCDLAGYILPDGSMLNFSYEGYQRDMNHRELNELIESLPDNMVAKELESGTDTMLWVMNHGFIRTSCSGIDIQIPPTQAQRETISYFIHRFPYECSPDEFCLDLSNSTGNCITSHLYPLYSWSASKYEVLRDIDLFFRLGFIYDELEQMDNEWHTCFDLD